MRASLRFGSAVTFARRTALASMIGVCPAVLAVPETARASDGFVDSIGVNIHFTHYLGFSTATYDNWDGVIGAISTLGIRNVRDHVADGQHGIGPDRLNQLTAATGAKVDGILELHYFDSNSKLVLDPNSVASQIAYAKQVNGLIAIEGPSEYDQYNAPNWVNTLINYQTALYTAAKADPALAGLPVLAPSVTNPTVFAQFSSLAAYSDKGNVHYYPANTTPTGALSNWQANAAQMVGNKPVWVTETGYQQSTLLNLTFDISPAAVAKYMPRLLMDYYNAGIEKTYLYELADDNVDPNNSNPENILGLVRTDFSLKPSGVAVKNLISLLGDPGQKSIPGSLDYTLTGGNATLRHMLLQKGNGKFYLALWQDLSVFNKDTNSDLINPDLPVSITFNSAITGLKTYLPDGSTDPVATYGAVSQVNLNVPDQVMLLEITPTPEPTTGLVAGVALAWGFSKRGRRVQRPAKLSHPTTHPCRSSSPRGGGPPHRAGWSPPTW